MMTEASLANAALVEVGGLELRLEPGADLLQVLGGGGLHLDLHRAVLRINVIELLLVGLARVQFGLPVQVLAHPGDRVLARDGQPERIQPGILEVLPPAGAGGRLEGLGCRTSSTEPKLKSSRMLPN